MSIDSSAPRRTLLQLGLAAALVAGLPAIPVEAQEVTLRVHHFLPPPSVTHKNFIEPWARKVEAESGGRIKIEIYPSMQLGGRPPALYDQVRDGVADIVWTLPGYTAGRFPITEVFELPFMAASAEATSQAAHEFYLQHAVAEFADIHPLMVHVHAPGSLHLNRKEVKTLEDMEGLKLRAPTRMTNAALEALGATPIGMPVPAVPESLARGVIDGAALPYEVALPLKVHELTTSHTEIGGEPGLYTAVFLFAMNKARYESLPADLRAVIDANSGTPLAKQIGRVWDEAERPGRAAAEEAGATFNRIEGAELQRWQEATAGVTAAWIAEMNAAGRDGQALVDAARDLIAKYAAQ
jgi:TRAP-type transport system periplasmic protein